MGFLSQLPVVLLRTALILTSLCYLWQGAHASSYCTAAKQDNSYSLYKDERIFDQTFFWRLDLKDDDKGKINISECTLAKGCSTFMEPGVYRSTMQLLSTGLYRFTLTFLNVDREMDFSVIGWYLLQDSTEIVLGECTLEVYSYNSPLECDEPKLVNTGTVISPAMHFRWTCSISNVYPSPRCAVQVQFQDKNRHDHYFSWTSDAYVSLKIGPASGSPVFYNNNTCTFSMPTMNLAPGRYKFKMPFNAQTDRSINVWSGPFQFSPLITFEIPEPVCSPLKFIDDNQKVLIECESGGSSYGGVSCHFYYDQSKCSLIDATVKTNTTCDGTPVSCINRCSATFDLSDVGFGTYTFISAMLPVFASDQNLEAEEVIGNSPSLTLSLPEARMEQCPRGDHVTGNYIKQGTSAACDCRLVSEGWPTGKVQWLNSLGGALIEGQDTATLVLTYSEHDPNPTYTCTVFSRLGQGSTFLYSPLFAFGPSQLSMTVSGGASEQNDPNQSCESVRFPRPVSVTCQVPISSASPDLVMTLEGAGSGHVTSAQRLEGEEGVYSATFDIRPDQGGVFPVRCVGSNVLFPELNAMQEQDIPFHAPPTTPPKLSVDSGLVSADGKTVQVVNGTQLRVHCQVEGGYPQVSEVVIACADRQEKAAEPHASLALSLDQTMDRWVCVCSATHDTGCYGLTTQLTLRVGEECGGQSDCNNAESGDQDSGDGLGVAVVAGAAVGAGLIFGAIGFLIGWKVQKKRGNRPDAFSGLNEESSGQRKKRRGNRYEQRPAPPVPIQAGQSNGGDDSSALYNNLTSKNAPYLPPRAPIVPERSPIPDRTSESMRTYDTLNIAFDPEESS